MLQKALGLRLVVRGLRAADQGVVIAFESKRHLTANGIVTAVVWRALG